MLRASTAYASASADPRAGTASASALADPGTRRGVLNIGVTAKKSEEQVMQISGTTSIGTSPATTTPVDNFTGDNAIPRRQNDDKGTRSNFGEPEEGNEELEESARSMTPSPVRSKFSFGHSSASLSASF